MKGSENFKNTIQNYLNELAIKDELFAKNLAKENKNIDDCITYILNQVKESGCNGFADEEIYNMAIHYYDEDDIKVGKSVNTSVVVNHTDFNQKKATAPQKEKSANKTSVKEKSKVAPKTEKTLSTNQLSNFDIPSI